MLVDTRFWFWGVRRSGPGIPASDRLWVFSLMVWLPLGLWGDCLLGLSACVRHVLLTVAYGLEGIRWRRPLVWCVERHAGWFMVWVRFGLGFSFGIWGLVPCHGLGFRLA